MGTGIGAGTLTMTTPGDAGAGAGVGAGVSGSGAIGIGICCCCCCGCGVGVVSGKGGVVAGGIGAGLTCSRQEGQFTVFGSASRLQQAWWQHVLSSVQHEWKSRTHAQPHVNGKYPVTTITKSFVGGPGCTASHWS